MVDGLHHLHGRKPLRKEARFKRFLDRIIYLAGVIGPLMTIPQVWKVWHYQDASGVAASSWGAYAATSVVWILYGIAHKERPIIFVYSLWLVLNSAVFVGALIY